MADNIVTTTPTTTVRPEDVTSVGTRISWGAVLAGTVVAMAFYMVLTTLGAAIGLSVGNDFRTETLAKGGLVWVIVTTALSLFAGGWTVSQLTAGETKGESMIHGLILWGTIVAVMLGLTASGIRSGFTAMLNVAYAGNMAADREGGLEQAARNLGYSQERIDRMKEAVKAKAEKAEDAANDKESLDSARRGAAMVTWGTLFGMLLSMGAAIGGALVGAGPSSRRLLWAGKPPLQRTTTAERPFASQI